MLVLRGIRRGRSRNTISVAEDASIWGLRKSRDAGQPVNLYVCVYLHLCVCLCMCICVCVGVRACECVCVVTLVAKLLRLVCAYTLQAPRLSHSKTSMN